jgi:SAM-dependent methyltransferase
MELIDVLTKDPSQNINYQGRTALIRKLKYFSNKVNSSQKILDVGQRNLLTKELEKIHNVKIDNTTGDLDVNFEIPNKDYDIIIYSHTIEHQFNPLYTLLELKKVLKPEGLLYILLPERGKLLWTSGHYHEIDDYRMKLILKRSGFLIKDTHREKAWRHWAEYIKGFRPFYRFFREFDATYVVKKAD